MSIPTTQELKDLAYSTIIGNEYTDVELIELFDYYADAINAKKEGYRYLKAVVYAEQFSLSESVNIQDPQDKLIAQDYLDMSSLTILRESTGRYKVTTGYNDALTSNLRDNGRVNIQTFQDLSSNSSLRSGDAVITGSSDTVSTKVTYVSNGVFDVYLVADKGTQNENPVDCAFYLTIELFNMPVI